MKYDKWYYVSMFPDDVQKGIRKAIAKRLREQSDRYNRCSQISKTAMIDDICNERLANLEGLDHDYWVAKANRRH